MNSCIFCKIISREKTAMKLIDLDNAMSFLDIAPLADGHSLLLPKRHGENLFDLTQEELMSLGVLTSLTVELLLKTIQPDYFTLLFNHGEHAGQTVFHSHGHLIPRYNNDGLVLSEEEFLKEKVQILPKDDTTFSQAIGQLLVSIVKSPYARKRSRSENIIIHFSLSELPNRLFLYERTEGDGFRFKRGKRKVMKTEKFYVLLFTNSSILFKPIII